MKRRRAVTKAILLAVGLTLAPVTGSGPAWASTGCDALNQPSADGFYWKGRFPASFLQAGDKITLTAGLPVGPSATNYVPTTFYIGVGAFDAAPTQTADFPGTLVYTVKEDLTSAHLTWATYPEVPEGTNVEATWTVSCQNAPKASPTLTTQASASTMVGGPVRDTATLAAGTNPTGSITFRLFGPDDATCTGPPVFTTTTTVNGNGAYQSAPFTPATPGTYRWVAGYAGDGSNNAASSPCNAPDESVVVTPFAAPPATSTLTGDVAGPVTVGSGQSVVVRDARVVGPLTVEAGGALTLVNARVTNGIVATNPAFFSVCGSQVAAPTTAPGPSVTVSGASVPVRVGDPAAGCAGNRVAGDVILSDNTGGLTLGGNTISGSATVDNNSSGAVVIKANTVFGTLACSGNNPAPVNGGQVNSAGAKTGQCSAL